MSYKITCDFCGELSRTEMCDHCASADEHGVLLSYLAGKEPCPGCALDRVVTYVRA